jgi:hypothetical protein
VLRSLLGTAHTRRTDRKEEGHRFPRRGHNAHVAPGSVVRKTMPDCIRCIDRETEKEVSQPEAHISQLHKSGSDSLSSAVDHSTRYCPLTRVRAALASSPLRNGFLFFLFPQCGKKSVGIRKPVRVSNRHSERRVIDGNRSC